MIQNEWEDERLTNDYEDRMTLDGRTKSKDKNIRRKNQYNFWSALVLIGDKKVGTSAGRQHS